MKNPIFNHSTNLPESLKTHLKIPPQLENIKCIRRPPVGSDPLNQSKAGLQQDTETQGKFFRFPPAVLGKQAAKLRTYMEVISTLSDLKFYLGLERSSRSSYRCIFNQPRHAQQRKSAHLEPHPSCKTHPRNYKAYIPLSTEVCVAPAVTLLAVATDQPKLLTIINSNADTPVSITVLENPNQARRSLWAGCCLPMMG